MEANSKFNFRPHRLVSGFGCGKHYHKHFKTVTLGYSATAVYLNFKHAFGITFHLSPSIFMVFPVVPLEYSNSVLAEPAVI